MITIRKATPNDIHQLEILFQVCRQLTFVSRHPDEFQIGDYQKSTAEDEVWVAEEHGSIVGFVSTYPADNFIHNLFVHPEQQAKNIGTQLLHIAEANLGRPMAWCHDVALAKSDFIYFVYSIQSKNNPDRYYIGLTSDVELRLEEHNAGKSIHTNKFKPWNLITYTAFADKSRAEKFEAYLKTSSGRAFAKKRL